jgi:hypothetical protein
MILKVILFSSTVIGLIFSILRLYLKKDSSKRRFDVALIILSTIPAIIGFFYDPTPKNLGILRPKQKISNKENNNKNILQLKQDEQIIKFNAPLNTIVQPFGPNVYLTLVKTKEGLRISVKIISLDNKVVAKMINNQWVLNPNNYFRVYYDESALEIIDEYEIPILQIEYVDSDTIKVGGIFRAENDLVSKIDLDFPAKKDTEGGIIFWLPNKSIIIVGKEGIRSGDYLKNLPLDEFITEAKKVIKPWFDYNNPQIPSRRK